ncbi:FCD domain-containing protein [Amycolatopsis sp. NPDC004368]
MQSSDQSGSSLPKRRYLRIAQALLSEIQQGGLAAGARLPSDRDLSVKFEVSRATVREALFAMELSGAIVVRHGDGTYVADLSRGLAQRVGQEIGSTPEHVIAARLVVEPPISRLLAATPGDIDLGEVQRDLDIATRLIDEPAQLPDFVNHSMAFHADLAAMCPNHLLNHFASELVEIDRQPLWVLINQIILKDREKRVELIADHQRVLDAIRSDGPEAAEEAMKAHLQRNQTQLFPGQEGAEQPPAPRRQSGTTIARRESMTDAITGRYVQVTADPANPPADGLLLSGSNVPEIQNCLGAVTIPAGAPKTGTIAHATSEVMYVAQGSGRLHTDQGVMDFERGQAIFIPAASWHALENTGAEDLVSVFSFPLPNRPPTQADDAS